MSCLTGLHLGLSGLGRRADAGDPVQKGIPDGRQERRPKTRLFRMGTTAWATLATGTTESQTDQEGREHATATGAPRYSRRLSDKILIAFHHACDQGDFEVAEQLLQVLEMMLTRRPLTPDGTRRRNMESLVAAHERLWHLRHPHIEEQ